MKDKILFLDIDGVLNSYQSSTFHHHISEFNDDAFVPGSETVKRFLAKQLCPIAVANLFEIVKVTKCKIVVSSTWRLGSDLKEMKSWFEDVPLIQEAIIGKTPHRGVKNVEPNSYGVLEMHNVPRGLEIKIWISENGYDSYRDKSMFVIIDDDSDMWPLQDNFIQIDSKVGLDWYKKEAVIDFLNKDKEKK